MSGNSLLADDFIHPDHPYPEVFRQYYSHLNDHKTLLDKTLCVESLMKAYAELTLADAERIVDVWMVEAEDVVDYYGFKTPTPAQRCFHSEFYAEVDKIRAKRMAVAPHD